MENESASDYYDNYNSDNYQGWENDANNDETAYFMFIADGALLCAVCLFGLLGNIFTLFILCRPQMKSTVNHYLQHLAVYDMLFLICKIFLHVIYEFSTISTVMWRIYMALYPGFINFVRVLLYMVRMGSIWTTVGVSIERYIVVCHPLKGKSFCTYKRAIQANFIIAVSVICYNIPHFFVYKMTDVFDDVTNETATVLNPSDFGRSVSFRVYETWITVTVNSIIPLLSLLFLNISIYLTIRKARKFRKEMTQKQETDIKLSMMLFCVVIVFLICYTPSFIFGIAATVGLNEWYSVRVPPMMHLMEAVNSSVNFIIYSAMGQHFRNVVLQFFCGKRLQRSEAIRKQ